MSEVTNIRKVEKWKCDEGFEFRFEPIESTVVVEKTKDGHEVKYLTVDENPDNPRETEDNLGIMICFHQRYKLGDSGNPYKSSEFNGWSELIAKIREDASSDGGVVVILPIFMLDHSGLRVSTQSFNDAWDSGKIGCIYTTVERVEEILGCPENLTPFSKCKITEILKDEVERYDCYLSGEVYCCVIEVYDEDKNHIDYDVVAGFYGHDDALEYLKDMKYFNTGILKG